uniref:Core Histone H2A/H2B/H3 domain-containing protein n=1 Tax=viral metagenome TaxID=1070528 RepID=A0A6C0F7V6_9ZZZZ|tara:strand:+ start:2355 stop:3149 length:795 start_codon:yes stop_codon:yes gene_type:complete
MSDSESEENIDIVYELINTEGFNIDAEKLQSIEEEIREKYNLWNSDDKTVLNHMRAYLLEETFNINIDENKPQINNEDCIDEHDFEETETEVDSDEEEQMEKDMEIEDNMEEEESKLDNWLHENKYFESYMDDDVISQIYNDFRSGDLNKKDAIQNFEHHKAQSLSKIQAEDPEFVPDPTWLCEIKCQQEKTDFCLNKDNFENLIREITQDINSNITNFEPEVFEMLQSVSEDYLLEKFRFANYQAIHSGRDEIRPKDFYSIRF